MVKTPVYMDYNATTPCDSRVVEAMQPYFTSMFGNAASRTHSFGWQAEEAVDIGREQVARLIGAEPKEIVFLSGATEADNLAIKGAYEAYKTKGNHIVTVRTEHKAVLDTCRHLEKAGAEITYLDVGNDGLIDLEKLESAILPSTILIAVMYANNETGVIQPVQDISRIARAKGILFFTDAAQAAGKIPIDVNRDGIDLMAISGHKIYGPKGIGALYVRRRDPRARIIAQMDGGGHERGFRSGTLNVPAVAGFGKAAEIYLLEGETERARLRLLRDRLENGMSGIEETTVNGNLSHRLAQVTNISFKWLNGEALVMAINKDLAVSTGSACSSASMEPSHVLRAMGLPEDQAHSSIRFSLGRFSTEEEVDFSIELLTMAVRRERAESPLWELFMSAKGERKSSGAIEK
jgi:cysteine desulfurase